VKRLGLALLLIAALAGTARGQSAGPQFADWTAGADGHAEGTLLGRPVTIAGDQVSHFTLTDGSSPIFSDPAIYTPALPASDYVYFSGDDPAPSFSVTFAAPVQDPTFHFYSLASTIAFAGAQATLVSGDGHLHVAGGTITPDRVGGADSNGTVRLAGTFSSLTFTAEYTGPAADGVYMQLGASPVPPTVTVTPVPTTSPPPPPPTPQLLPADKPPETGVSVSTKLAAGTVSVKLPGGQDFVPLAGAASLPVGSVVDARQGVVSFRAAGASATQSATLSAGIFAIRQARVRGATAAFVLQTPPGQARACAGPKKGAVRTLTIAAKGVFRTVAAKGVVKGRNATWTVSDRCDGTLTTVKRGRVAVTSRHRTQTVRAGRRLLIKARLFGARRRS
jgi:hypothetical protein